MKARERRITSIFRHGKTTEADEKVPAAKWEASEKGDDTRQKLFTG